MVSLRRLSRSAALPRLIMYNDRPREPLCAAITIRKRPAGRGRAGAGRPTPIIFQDVGDGHDYHSGDQLSFPNITKRHGHRRCAGELARARRSLRRRLNLLVTTLRGQLDASKLFPFQ